MAKVARCPQCGQIIPPANPFLAGFHRHPVKAAIYDVIALRPDGVTRAEVMDHVYRSRQDGGPLCGKTIVSVHIGQMNKKLERLGLCIRSSMGHGAVYRLIGL